VVAGATINGRSAPFELACFRPPPSHHCAGYPPAPRVAERGVLYRERMNLVLSIASETRPRAKALRRVLPIFRSLEQQFSAITLQHPIHHALLVGIVERPPDYFDEVPNRNGEFQVHTGYDLSVAPLPENDTRLSRDLFQRIRAAVLACPFSTPDRDAVQQFLDHWAQQALPRE